MKRNEISQTFIMKQVIRDVRGAKKIAPHRTATFVPSHRTAPHRRYFQKSRTAPHRTADIFKNRAPHRTALQEKIFKLLITKKKIF